MKKRNLLFVVLYFLATSSIYAQKKAKAKQLPSIAIGAGLLTFNGDIGNGATLNSLSKIRAGYNLTIEQRIGKYLGLSLNGIYGKLSDSERTEDRNLNFESEIIQGDLNIVLHFDNDLIFSRKSIFAPYLFAGIGYLKFDPHGDLTDKNNTKYNYWSDGTIHDISETDPMASTSTILQRDYTYETQLIDSVNSYNRGTFALPIGGGFNLKILNNLSVNIGATYYLSFSDWIDNFKDGKNDQYIFANVSVQYNFGKEKEESNPDYTNVDFTALDMLDNDADGVNDADDRCPGTPKGVKVNGRGCPDDNDEDGVSDYMDKELMTKKNAFVDDQGITISEKMIADKQNQYDSLATERSQLFNENPSLYYLKDVETKSKETRKSNPAAASSIPYALRSADQNNDGFISADEITIAIDQFFEGDSNYTVERLNDLIDFFFEQ